MRCPECRFDNPLGIASCRRCGARLEAPPPKASDLPANTAPEIACPACQARMPDDANFCGLCGRRLRESPVAQSPPPSQESSARDPLNSTGQFLGAAAEAGRTPVPEPPGALRPMVHVPAGRYAIGSPAPVGNPDEHPRHKVPLSAFYIEKYAVSNEQYERFDPDHRRLRQELDGDREPVVFVTYQDCLRYCRWRSEQEGLPPDAYSLPTEAQWEAAARGGSDDAVYPWGNEVSAERCNTIESGHGRTLPVDEGTPNGLGLVHVGDNIREWCRDVYSDTFYSSREASQPDPTGPGEMNLVNMRVVRGASFQDKAAELGRCAARNYAHPGNSYNDIGFRCVRKKD